jgi:hypothetical protein
MPKACPRCGNCHIRLLIFAPLGVRVLLLNDWEQDWQTKLTDRELEYWENQYSNLGIVCTNSLRDFLGKLYE